LSFSSSTPQSLPLAQNPLVYKFIETLCHVHCIVLLLILSTFHLYCIIFINNQIKIISYFICRISITQSIYISDYISTRAIKHCNTKDWLSCSDIICQLCCKEYILIQNSAQVSINVYQPVALFHNGKAC